MESQALINGLIMYIGLVILLTFHEFGHAWMALKCGDDTARLEGRISLNPLVHIDPIGTVLIPLIGLFLSLQGSGAAGFLVGWAKPVPVNLNNLRNPRLDDILVTLAGPWMNVLLAIALLGLARLGQFAEAPSVSEVCATWALVSLFLCFFNLLPIPPLDGSRVVRAVFNIPYEAYYQFARFGIIILIVVIQIPLVRRLITEASFSTWFLIARLLGFKG